MKVGAASVGYTSGALYKRNKTIAYTPGAHYQRFGKFGLHQARNMSSMNRQAVESGVSAYQNAGPQMFETQAAHSQGLSELAANQLMERVKKAMAALADKGDSISLANGGTGSTVDETA